MNETNILSVGQLYRKIKTAQEKGNTIDERRAWASLLENKSIQGSSTEFHNLSVTFYQDDDYITALEIVDKGLETYGSDKDLLGDALLYSLCIGNLEKAKEIYQRINNFPQSSWSWRCFAYSIRYVMDTKEASRTDEETSRLLDEALKLSLSYQHYFPNDEKGYMFEHEILIDKSRMDDKHSSATDEEIEHALLKACNLSNIFLPAIAQKYVERMMNMRKFREAFDMCEKIYNNVHYGETVNFIKIAYLQAIAQTALILGDINNGQVEDVVKAYTRFSEVISSGDNTVSKTEAIHYCRLLAERTDIAVPDELQAYIS